MKEGVGQKQSPTTQDIPVYKPEKMSTKQLTQAVLNAGAATNKVNGQGTK